MPLGFHKAAIFGVAGASSGDAVLLSEQTGVGVASMTFSSDIDDTYGEYIFHWYNFNPATDGKALSFQVNPTDGSGYDRPIVSTYYQCDHAEADGGETFAYFAGEDLAGGTTYQRLNLKTGNGADESSAGEFHLFNPSSTVLMKHFIARSCNVYYGDYMTAAGISGYINDTTAIDEIQFKSESGNMDIKMKMWGVK